MITSPVPALLEEFNVLLELSFSCPEDLMRAAEEAAGAIDKKCLRSKSERRKELFALVNSRLGLNREALKVFIDQAAKQRHFFNYHDRNVLAAFFDGSRSAAFHAWCDKREIGDEVRAAFLPKTEAETVKGLHELLATGRVNRSDARDCALEEKQVLIQRALFGCFVFRAFNDGVMHRIFNEDAREEYYENYLDHLRAHHADQLHRECALIYYDIDLEQFSDNSAEELSDLCLTGIRSSYERLANHCYFAIRLRATTQTSDRVWRLFSDIVLFAEKHREIALTKGYFRPDAIRETTKNYIGSSLDEDAARFDLANEGFFFKDCFILSHAKSEGTTDQPYDLLVLFEKNQRDERVVPCPACRSRSVGGNSYPTLGVRSWECQNLICPERSAYDRGNRYSLASIIRQEAIASDEDQIPLEVRRRWRNDVVFHVNDDEVTDMLLRQFSLHKDSILIVGPERRNPHTKLGRKISYEQFGVWDTDRGIRSRFFEGPLFKRFLLKRPEAKMEISARIEELGSNIQLVNGDCEIGLDQLEPDLLDGAVTSPPYYNARAYSQWPNIYCYLYDMYNAARAVFRSLKPGGLFVYNIFDYFDNENVVTLSAMGKKRMILGAYIINAFEQAGFEVAGNVIWFKGDIEGKRNFNGGNDSPYYQLPFNCWEHCLLFRKAGAATSLPGIQLLKQRPVLKMVRGKNTHGHTAPFPPAIAQLLLDVMPAGATVLDPYAGSMTTACAAIPKRMGALMFELDEEFYELGLRNVRDSLASSTDLFSRAGDLVG